MKTKHLLLSATPTGQEILSRFEKRLRVANRSEQTIRNYVRHVKGLINYHSDVPENLDIEQVIDFLHYLRDDRERSWRTLKIYVAGIRWYYQHILQNEDMASQIPYPKEQKSLPDILSRDELGKLFSACRNEKHRVMFRLMYSSGLRRSEVLNLKPDNIDTKDGKRRILIRQGKGKKDRYTVLSEKVLEELRVYYRSFHPRVYLFNGRYKGEPMSTQALRHALGVALKRSGITKPVNMHVLRHCFATHAIEEGMHIKTLQYLLGHSSVKTTMVYLHISEVPLEKAFSPLDRWEQS